MISYLIAKAFYSDPIPEGALMMNYRKLPLSLAIVFLLVLRTNAGEAEDRIAEFLSHQSEVEACMSVLISRVGLTELTGPDLNENLSFSEVLQRVIICRDTNEERVDAKRNIVGRDFSIKEAQVIAGGECLHWSSSRLKQEINRIGMKAGRPLRRTESGRIHPYTLPITTSTLVGAEMPEKNIFHETFTVVDEFELKNGRYRAYFVIKGAADSSAGEVTFAKEPRWAPVEYRVYIRGDAPKPSGKLTGSVIKAWTLLHTTSTEWQPIDDEPGWLPSKVNMESEDQTIITYEFLLTDWKLGNNVDRGPLQKPHFTPENIPKQIDFDKVAAAFEKIRDKRKK
jgi:hypothetical protein